MKSPTHTDGTPKAEGIQPSESSLRAGYETSDVQIRGLILMAIVLAAVVIGTGTGIWALIKVLNADATAADPQLSPIANVEQIPPEPRLQSTPNADYETYKREK